MLLLIYSRSMSRSVVVVHFAIVLNKVVSSGVISNLRDILYVYSSVRSFGHFKVNIHTIHKGHACVFQCDIILRIYNYMYIFTNILNNVIHIYLCGKLHCIYALKSGTDDK